MEEEKKHGISTQAGVHHMSKIRTITINLQYAVEYIKRLQPGEPEMSMMYISHAFRPKDMLWSIS